MAAIPKYKQKWVEIGFSVYDYKTFEHKTNNYKEYLGYRCTF